MRVEEWPTTITFQPGALKNDPASSKRRPPTRRRLRDGECGPASQRLWKRHPHETMGLFDNIRLHRLARRDVVPFDAVLVGENGGEKLVHGSGGMELLRAA